MTLLQKLMAHAGLNPKPVEPFPELLVLPPMPLSPALAEALKRASEQPAPSADGEVPEEWRETKVWGRHSGVFR